MCLHQNKMTPVESLAEAKKNPKETVIIVFGTPRFLDKTPEWDSDLKRFLDQGGNLLIATDHELNAHELSISFSGLPIRTPNKWRKFYAYRDELECPKLTYTARISEWIDQVAPNKKDQIPRSHPTLQLSE